MRFDNRFKYQNLMFERRVVRGNTYSAYVMSKEDEFLYKLNNQPAVKAAMAAPKGNLDPKLQASLSAGGAAEAPDQGSVWGENPPLGKKYAECYTSKKDLEETDLPPCHDATTQTDFIIEKEIPDLSMPIYRGIHKETQIYPNEPPFDFEYEAEPLVQVLMTRILEDSRIEVLEEEELRAMKQRQEHIIAHKAEVKRKLNELEERERQMVRANNEKKAAEHEKKKKVINTHQHLVSRVFAKNFLRDVQNASLEILGNMGLFEDEVTKEAKDDFMPWLYNETLKNLQNYNKLQKFVDSKPS